MRFGLGQSLPDFFGCQIILVVSKHLSIRNNHAHMFPFSIFGDDTLVFLSCENNFCMIKLFIETHATIKKAIKGKSLHASKMY